MKLHGILLTIIISIFVLAGCASNPQNYQSSPHENLTNETWFRHINLSSDSWIRNTDPWFHTGAPHNIDEYLNSPPQIMGKTAMAVNVGSFNCIEVNGSFQVQIVGGQASDSVYILGPYNSARQLIVQNSNNTLHISQPTDAKNDFRKVIVRIGMRNLKSIVNLGKSNIYGRNITSDHLNLTAYSSGSIVLAGQMNLSKVLQLGSCAITVIGAYSPCVYVTVKGNGTVNICGRVGIQRITNTGGCVNIIGADTDSLAIYANDSGTTNVTGYANLKKVTASGYSRVYVYCINSPSLSISQTGCSHVGLAGRAANMNVELMGSARFEGQYLHGSSIYVRTSEAAHANLTPDIKVFAAAFNRSSIYLFGSPAIVSKYPAGGGLVLPVFNDTSTSAGPCCNVPAAQPTLVPRVVYKQ